MENEDKYYGKMQWKMRRKMGKMMFGGFVGMIFMTWGLKFLWNALIPSLFGGPIIGFFQALGLLLLAKILFGGGCRRGRCCGGHKGGHWRQKFREKMDKMSPEERAKFKDSFMGKGYEVNVYEVEEEEEEEGNRGEGEEKDSEDEGNEKKK